MERIEYLGHKECVRLSNGTVEVVVAAHFGPRVLHYGFAGAGNVFGLFPDMTVETEMGVWCPVGGHRLWTAPESNPHSYAPDDAPVEIRNEGALIVRATAPADKSGIEKTMVVGLMPTGSEVEVRHQLVNRTGKPIDIAPWAMTILDGGTSVVPLEPYRSHADALHPTQPLVLWPFTDLTDPRIKIESRAIRVAVDPNAETPQKIGLLNRREWAGYLLDSTLFVKHYPCLPGATYPDFGVNTEIFVRGRFMELETLGPIVRLAPDAVTEHIERWRLVANVGKDELAAHLGQTP